MGIYKTYLRRYKWLFILGVACVSMETVCDLLQPTIMASIIDVGVKNKSLDSVLHYGMVMLGVTLLGAVFAAARNIMASTVSQNFSSDLRYDVFAKIMRFSQSSADKIESGSLITRMTNDTQQVTQFIGGLMRIFVKAPLTGIGSIVFAVILSPKLSLVIFAVAAVVSVLIVMSMRMSYRRFAKVQKAIDRVNTVVQEYLSGVRLVKAFGRFDEEEEKFDTANTDLKNKSAASQNVIALFAPLMTLAASIGVAVILYFGSRLFLRQAIEVGKVAAFINYMLQILNSLIRITNIFTVFVRTKASTERIKEIFDSEEEGSGAPAFAAPRRAGLRFSRVKFAYPHGSGLPALNDLSFDVEPGQTLAVIGPTGAGKSTLAWLCLKFYRPDEGRIEVNGTDINEIDPAGLRDCISLAPQQSMLFSGTVEQNIGWGSRSADAQRVNAAAVTAQADEFIRAMPDGYDSVLGQGGVNLSGGQKQRISIARALVKNTPILILDDCTSALDAVTDARVRRGLKDASGDQTVILITQRISTAMSADKVLVLERGESVGFGTHAQLLKTCPTYRDIYVSQIGDVEEGAANA